MSGMEWNKIFAAVLVAGIVAMLSGFVAGKFVHPDELEANAFPIEGVSSGVAAIAKPKGPAPIMHLIAQANVEKGKKLSQACAACHSFDKGGPAKVGPNLWNVVGGPKASKGGFSYSSTLAEMGGAWSYDSLNKFLYKPKSYVPNTKMNFIGLKKPEDRAAMIAWMRTLADTPPPLPTQGQIDEEIAELAPPEAVDEPAAEEAAH